MYYLLIILGLALVTVGIVGLTQNNSQVKDTEKFDSSELGLTENEIKGKLFQRFVRDNFNPTYYSLISEANDSVSYRHREERSDDPDLLFRLRQLTTQTKFAVECKYRSFWSKYKGEEQVEWASEDNINHYLAFAEEQKIDVVEIIGVGGTPDNPDEIYAAPLKALSKYTFARKSYLEQFRLSDPHGSYKYILSKHNVCN